MILIILFIFAILLLIVISGKIEYTSKLFILSFQIIWCVVLVASTFQPYDLYLPDDYTYFLLITNVVCFSFGFMVLKRFRGRILNLSSVDIAADNLLKNIKFKILVIIAGLISLYYFSIFQAALNVAGNLGEVRTEYYSGELLGPTYSVINGVFLQPMLIICYPLLGYALYRRNWMVVPVLLFMILINSLSGGRFGYVKIFYALIFFFGCVKRLNKKKIIGLSAGALLLFFSLAYVTAGRSDASGNTFDRIERGIDGTLEHITTYACGATVALDYSIEHDYTNQIDGHTYGTITGSSIVQVAYIICNKIGLPFEQPMEKLGKLKQNSYISVGKSRPFNALYTSVLFFYTDFGLLGVILIPFLLGMLCRFLIKKFLTYQTFPLLILITYCYILSMFSITDFNFTTYTSLFMVILLYWLGIKKGKKNKISQPK